MANRDVKSTNGGGLVPVTTLPEKGNIGTLYKTPDGSVYYWFHEETPEEVDVPPTTLEVGKTYQLRESIPLIEFGTNIDKITGGKQTYDLLTLDEEPFTYAGGNIPVNRFLLEEYNGDDGSGISLRFNATEASKKGASYQWNNRTGENIVSLETVDINIPVMIKITQEFADKLAELEKPIELEKLAFIFGKTETITVVNEGYIKVGGVFVLDSKNIADSGNMFNDSYYNAKTIINNALKGVVFVLKEEDSSNQSVHFSRMTYFTYGKNPEENIYYVAINFTSGRSIWFYDENFYAPETITGKELKEKMLIDKATNGLAINNANIYDYVVGNCPHELAEKIIADGVMLSMFDGLIQWINKPDESEEGGDGYLRLKVSFGENEYEENLAGHQNVSLDNLNLENTETVYPYYLGFDNIIDEKEYSTSIEVTFADGTTISIKTYSYFIEDNFVPNLEIGPGPFY